MKKIAIVAATILTLVAVACSKDETTLLMNSTQISVSNAGATQNLSFDASTDWTIASDQDWITFNPASGASGTNTVAMTVAPNTTYSDRTATVTLTAKDKVTKYTVTQSETETFASSIVYNISAEEQNIALAVTSNIEYKVTVADDAKDWIKVVTTKADPTSGTITLKADANKALESRTGHFTVSAGINAQTYEVVQAANYTSMKEASAVYYGHAQWVYNSESSEYNTFGEYYFSFTAADGNQVCLAVNVAKEKDDSTVAIPTGTFDVDAAANHADGTFSIKKTDGSESVYTVIKSGSSEIAVEDGEITITKASDGTYSIVAVLVDAAGSTHSYAYVGAMPAIADKSFGGQVLSADFLGTYNTYFASKANEWNVSISTSKAPTAAGMYFRYMSFNLYTAAGDVDKTVFPTGKFTFAEPSSIESNYANGLTNATAGTFKVSYAQDAYGNDVLVKPETGATLTIVKNADGTYSFTVDGTFNRYYYDENYNQVLKDSFTYNSTIPNVFMPAVSSNTMDPMPDVDHEFKSAGMSSAMNGMYFGDPFSIHGSTLVVGFTSIDNNYTAYLAVEADSTAWQFVTNFRTYCNTPIPTGTYKFTTTAAKMTLVPILYNGSTYCYISNGYTGTKTPITGGSISFTGAKLTYDIQTRYTAPDGTVSTLKFTGTTDASAGLISNRSKYASKITMWDLK